MKKLLAKERKRRESIESDERRRAELQKRYEIFTPRTDLQSIEDFVHEVTLFMLNDQKLAESTVRVYKGALKRYLELLATSEPDMEIHKLTTTTWESHPGMIPVTSITDALRHQLTTAPGAVSQSCKAILQLSSFLNDHRLRNVRSMPTELNDNVARNLRDINETCQQLMKSVPKRASALRFNKLADSRSRGSLLVRSQAVWSYLATLHQSKRFADLIQGWSHNIGEQINRGAISPIRARTIALGLLMLEGNGIRSEALIHQVVIQGMARKSGNGISARDSRC